MRPSVALSQPLSCPWISAVASLLSPCLLLCWSRQWRQSDSLKHKSNANGALPAFLTPLSITVSLAIFILVAGLLLLHFLFPLCGTFFAPTVPCLCLCHWGLNLIFLEPCLDLSIWSKQPSLSAFLILWFPSFTHGYFSPSSVHICSLGWNLQEPTLCLIPARSWVPQTVFCIYMNIIIRCEMNKASLENAAHYLSLSESPNLHYIFMLLRSPTVKKKEASLTFTAYFPTCFECKDTIFALHPINAHGRKCYLRGCAVILPESFLVANTGLSTLHTLSLSPWQLEKLGITIPVLNMRERCAN